MVKCEGEQGIKKNRDEIKRREKEKMKTGIRDGLDN
jgi:hypothetical protein